MSRKIIVALALALVVGTSTATASGSRLHPVGCFRAHGWLVRGTNLHGTARKPQSGVPRRYWSFVTWRGPAPYSITYFATRREKRLIRLCLGRL